MSQLFGLSVVIPFSLSHVNSGCDVARLRVARCPRVCLFALDIAGQHLLLFHLFPLWFGVHSSPLVNIWQIGPTKICAASPLLLVSRQLFKAGCLPSLSCVYSFGPYEAVGALRPPSVACCEYVEICRRVPDYPVPNLQFLGREHGKHGTLYGYKVTGVPEKHHHGLSRASVSPVPCSVANRALSTVSFELFLELPLDCMRVHRCVGRPVRL